MRIFIVLLSLMPFVCISQPSPTLFSEDHIRMAAIRRAGLNGDRSNISSLLSEAVKSDSNALLRISAIRALAHLRSPESLAVLLRVATEDRVDEVRDVARICRSRINAELGANAIVDPSEKARVELNRFLQECDLAVSALNSAREKLDQDNRTHRRPPRELIALRELADMVYRRRFLALANTCVAAGIRFEMDAPSNLKISLAPLTSQLRIASLIDLISSLKVLKWDDDSTLQLAIDEGLPASKAAVARLQLMAADPERYHYIGFAALFEVIRGAGDKDSAPVIEAFLPHPNRWVRHYAAQVLPDVKAGIPRQTQPRF